MSVLSQIAKRPRLAYYFGQKAIRHPALRSWCARMVTAWVARKAPAPPLGDLNTTALEALRGDGIAFLPQLQLDADTLSQVHAHFEGKSVVDLYSGKVLPGMKNLPTNYNKVAYRIEDTLQCEALIALANHPHILQTVAQYLGAQPSIASMQAWWTIGEHSAQGQTHYDDVYHRDVDDLRFVKLFVYLTDTDIENGAHSFIKGSHRSDLLTRRGPISDSETHKNFPSESIITVTGRAGMVFLEDTWGIHRPLLATTGRRLIFSVLYNLVPSVPQSPLSPVQLMPTGLDPRVNRTHFSSDIL